MHGEGFIDECGDVVIPGQTFQPSRPAQDIDIRFTQDDRTVVVAEVDAREDTTFDVTVKVPRDADAGEAFFEAKGGLASPDQTRARFRVLASPSPSPTATPEPTPLPTAEPTPTPEPTPSPTPVPARSTSGALTAGIALAALAVGLGGGVAIARLRGPRV